MNDCTMKNHCYSKINFQKCSFMWTIERYEKVRQKLSTSMNSAPFSAVGDNLKWCLNHQRKTVRSCTYISLFASPDHTLEELENYGPISGRVKISIVRPDNSTIASKWKEFTINTGLSYERDHRDQHAGFEEFIKLSDFFKDCLFKDKLTIFCELIFARKSDIVDISFSLRSNQSKSSESTLSQAFEKLFDDKHFSDVILKVQGRRFRAHKGVLAARSSVFKAMFENNMLESASNRVDITDIDQKTCKKMLQYIYSGKVKDLEESAFELLPAADKYDLEELRSMCEEALSSKLSDDNAIEILILADMHRADKLKALAFQFIRSHSIRKNVEDTEIWKIVTTSHPHLMKDLINAFLLM